MGSPKSRRLFGEKEEQRSTQGFAFTKPPSAEPCSDARREGGKTVKSEFVIIREADTLNRHRTKTKVVRKGDPSHTTHL